MYIAFFLHCFHRSLSVEVDLLASAFLPDCAEPHDTVACVKQLLLGLEEAVFGQSAGVGSTALEGLRALGREAWRKRPNGASFELF